MADPTLAEVLAKLHDAGGFGDGVDFTGFRPLESLAVPDLSSDAKAAASLVLLSDLTEAMDNSTWKDAVSSSLGRRLTLFLKSGGATAPSCDPAIRAFFRSEAEFHVELRAVFSSVICGRAR